MNKTEAISAVIEQTSTEPIVFTTGYACRIAKRVADRNNHFYMTGSMGLASVIAAGVAWSTGRVAVVVDGDGSVLMNPAALATAGSLRALPLVHVVLDDSVYASTGGQSVPAGQMDLCALAGDSGYGFVVEVDGRDELAAVLAERSQEPARRTFVHCVLYDADLPVPARIDCDLGDHATRFSQSVRAFADRG